MVPCDRKLRDGDLGTPGAENTPCETSAGTSEEERKEAKRGRNLWTSEHTPDHGIPCPTLPRQMIPRANGLNSPMSGQTVNRRASRSEIMRGTWSSRMACSSQLRNPWSSPDPMTRFEMADCPQWRS